MDHFQQKSKRCSITTPQKGQKKQKEAKICLYFFLFSFIIRD